MGPSSKIVVHCTQEGVVVVIVGAPLAADATACVPSPPPSSLPVGGSLPASEHLWMHASEHINVYKCEQI